MNLGRSLSALTFARRVGSSLSSSPVYSTTCKSFSRKTTLRQQTNSNTTTAIMTLLRDRSTAPSTVIDSTPRLAPSGSGGNGISTTNATRNALARINPSLRFGWESLLMITGWCSFSFLSSSFFFHHLYSFLLILNFSFLSFSFLRFFHSSLPLDDDDGT
jgi:hypothetical protein